MVELVTRLTLTQETLGSSPSPSTIKRKTIKMKNQIPKMQFDGTKESGEKIVAWSGGALELCDESGKLFIKIPKEATAALKAQYAHPTDWIIRTWGIENLYFTCTDQIEKMVYKH